MRAWPLTEYVQISSCVPYVTWRLHTRLPALGVSCNRLATTPYISDRMAPGKAPSLRQSMTASRGFYLAIYSRFSFMGRSPNTREAPKYPNTGVRPRPRPLRRAMALPDHAAAALPAAAGHVRAAGPHRTYGRDGTVRRYGSRRRHSLPMPGHSTYVPHSLILLAVWHLAASPSIYLAGGRLASRCHVRQCGVLSPFLLQPLSSLAYCTLDLQTCIAAGIHCHILFRSAVPSCRTLPYSLSSLLAVRSASTSSPSCPVGRSTAWSRCWCAWRTPTTTSCPAQAGSRWVPAGLCYTVCVRHYAGPFARGPCPPRAFDQHKAGAMAQRLHWLKECVTGHGTRYCT